MRIGDASDSSRAHGKWLINLDPDKARHDVTMADRV